LLNCQISFAETVVTSISTTETIRPAHLPVCCG
jgi:hypothetical protein